MLKDFYQFINEDNSQDFIKDLAMKLISQIRNYSDSETEEYSIFSGIRFTEPYSFNLSLEIRKDSHFSAKEDSHFNGLPWEQLNFKEDGYSIDANTRVKKDNSAIPEIIITLVIDPKKEPHLYSSLYARLVDILTHETHHLTQLSNTSGPNSANPTTGATRENAKKSYEYFLLPDEIESMVEGMYARSNELKVPLDEIFDDYLHPFLVYEYITKDEYLKVMNVWIKYALENYPNVSFSDDVDDIINSI